uniref:variable large family protein n=1 Tax=Borrelia persica TaxID=44448 RepID=UPI0004636102|nr:variable large family protein [Borrelia persica]
MKDRLNAVVEKNGNYAKVKENIAVFITIIEKIEEGANEVDGGASGDAKIGGIPTKGQVAVTLDKNLVVSLVKGIKAIVGVVLKRNGGDAVATKTSEDDKRILGNCLRRRRIIRLKRQRQPKQLYAFVY